MKPESFLEIVTREFLRLKEMADRALAKLDDDRYFHGPDEESNCAAILVKHLSGNMLSRWRDFLTTDGEKPDRDRDSEFVLVEADTRADLERRWEKGWDRLFASLAEVTELGEDGLNRSVVIRGEPHTVQQAIHRQLTHYAYHTGQIVYLAKHLVGAEWETLSVAKGESRAFNRGPSSYLEGPKSGAPVWADREFVFDSPVEEFPEVLRRLQETPDRLEELVGELPPPVLVRRDGETWSIQENAGHLADVDELFLGRLEDYRAGAESLRPADMSGRRTFEARHNERELAAVLSDFRRRREEYVSSLEALPPEEFARSSHHPRLQKPMRLFDMLLFQAEHDDYHLARIVELAARFRGDAG